MTSQYLYRLALLLALLVSVGMFALSSVGTTGATGTAQSDQSALVSPPAISTPCPGGSWQVVPSPNLGFNTRNELFDVAVASPTDAWAVGWIVSNQPIEFRGLIMHWDGTQWTAAYSPMPPGASGAYLRGVEVIAPDDVWAVGAARFPNNEQRTLTIHWDGAQWSIVPSANYSPHTHHTLEGVTAVSSSEVWAAGSSGSHVSHEHALVYGWDGAQWSTAYAFEGAHYDSNLRSLSVAGPDEVWAVGFTTHFPDEDLLIARWTGSGPQGGWSQVPGPDVGPYMNALLGVSAVGLSEAWAVGYHDTNGGSNPDEIRPLTLHWSGSQWNVVPNPLSEDPSSSWLQDVEGASPAEVWAVGYRVEDANPNMVQTLTMRWDGTQAQWSHVPSPNAGAYNYLYAVDMAGHEPELGAAQEGADAWAVGSYSPQFGPARTLVMRFTSPSCGNITPTPTTMPALTSTPTLTPPPAPTGTPIPSTSTPTPCLPGGTPGPWQIASPMPTAARLSHADSDGTYVYVAGGHLQSGAAINRFARYNPVANSWQVLTPMPVAAAGPAVVYSPINNKIYAFGGGANNVTVNNTRIYDIATGNWSAGAPMPGTRSVMGAGYWNGKIYLAGGYLTPVFSNVQSQLWEYDPLANTWDTSRANMLGPRAGTGFGVVNGHLYIIGGASPSPNFTNTVFDYDIAANTWTLRTTMPTAVYGPGSAVINGRIWVFGGGQPFLGVGPQAVPNVMNITQIFDPNGYTWTSGPNLNVARNLLAGATVSNQVFAVGGYNGSSTDYATTEVSTVAGGCPTPGTPVPTATRTATPMLTSTPAPTSTAIPTSTSVPTDTPTGVPTSIPPTSTQPPPTSTTSTTSTPSPCSMSFDDVYPTDYFYEPVRYLYCRGVISGYSDNTFRPYNNATRGQMVKIITIAFGYDIYIPPTAPTFSDVAADHPFYAYVETAAYNNLVSGYDDNTFRPFANVTRGQLSKITVVAAAWPLINPQTPTFSDVPRSHPFYTYIETAYERGIISGYDDGTFRPYNGATRGQISKIVYNAVTAP